MGGKEPGGGYLEMSSVRGVVSGFESRVIRLSSSVVFLHSVGTSGAGTAHDKVTIRVTKTARMLKVFMILILEKQPR